MSRLQPGVRLLDGQRTAMTVFRRPITGEYAQRAAKTSCAAADHSRWRGRSGWTAAPRGAVLGIMPVPNLGGRGSAVWKARKAMYHGRRR